MALAESVSIGFTLPFSGPRRMLRTADRAPSVPMIMLPCASEPFSNEAVTPSLSSNESADIVMPYYKAKIFSVIHWLRQHVRSGSRLSSKDEPLTHLNIYTLYTESAQFPPRHANCGLFYGHIHYHVPIPSIKGFIAILRIRFPVWVYIRLVKACYKMRWEEAFDMLKGPIQSHAPFTRTVLRG